MADIYTDAGEDFVIDQIDAFGTYYSGWGTGAGTAAKGDTTLFTEASEDRVATTDSQPSSNQIQWVATITADGTKTITNAGIFSASTGSALIMHSDFTGVPLSASDSIQFTFQKTQS